MLYSCVESISQKDIDMLDKIHRRATIPGRRYLIYDERLKECGLTTLETRRLRGYKTEGFNILNGYDFFLILILIFFSKLWKVKYLEGTTSRW